MISPPPLIARMDGRWLVVVSLATYFTLLFAAHFSADYHQAWRWAGVPAKNPTFLDLRGTLAGAASARDGFDPILSNPHDRKGHGASYPHLWFWIICALELDKCNPVVLGIGQALAFYGCALWFASRLSLREGVVWSVLLCASPPMLAVERGNNDLVIFVLLALALLLRRRPAIAAAVGSYALIEWCAALKLFPICALCLALRERPRAALAILCAGGLAFAAYVFAIRDQLKAIQAKLPQPHTSAFGSRVFMDNLNAAHTGTIPSFVPMLAVAAILLVACEGWRRAPRLPVVPKWKVDGLMVGSAVYALSFILNNNFNYRLIFLLFALPALLDLCGEHRFYRALGIALTAALMVAWVFACQMQPWLFIAKEMANWTVFAGMTFLWLECLTFAPGDRSPANFA